MRHPVLECIPARAATHPPKQPATQEPAESQAASRAPSSAPGEAQHQQPQQEEQPTSTLNSPPSPPARGANSLVEQGVGILILIVKSRSSIPPASKALCDQSFAFPAVLGHSFVLPKNFNKQCKNSLTLCQLRQLPKPPRYLV